MIALDLMITWEMPGIVTKLARTVSMWKGYAMRSILSLAAFTIVLAVAQSSLAGDVILRGQFEGRSNHETSGVAMVEKSATGAMVILGKDFKFDGAPDPKVGFGRDGVYDASAQLHELKSKVGRQEYTAPSSVDPTRYNELYIWCQRYNVPLGVAKLK